MYRNHHDKKLAAKSFQTNAMRIAILENMGIVWDVQNDAWEQSYQELKRYKEENGHCVVPNKYPPNRPLGNWVGKQRLFYRGHRGQHLSEDRIARLEKLGFVWKVQVR